MDVAEQLLLGSPHTACERPCRLRAKCTAAELHSEASHPTSSSLCRGNSTAPQLSSQPHTCWPTPWPLQVEVPRLQHAISVACRLGFAKRLPNRNEGGGSGLFPAWLLFVLLAGCVWAAPISRACSPHDA